MNNMRNKWMKEGNGRKNNDFDVDFCGWLGG
jgi:hypothetical protein